MTDSFLLPAGAALSLSLLLVLGGSSWIDTLYTKASVKGILSFPDALRERARWRRPLLALGGAVCGWQLGATLSPASLPFGLIAAGFLLLVTITDKEQYLIFDAMLLPFALTGGIALLFLGLPPGDHLVAGAAGGLVFLLLAILTRGGIGGGDVKLMAVLGLWFGSRQLLSIAMIGLILGGVAALFLLVTGKRDRKGFFAYGPYFSLTALVLLLTGGFL